MNDGRFFYLHPLPQLRPTRWTAVFSRVSSFLFSVSSNVYRVLCRSMWNRSTVLLVQLMLANVMFDKISLLLDCDPITNICRRKYTGRTRMILLYAQKQNFYSIVVSSLLMDRIQCIYLYRRTQRFLDYIETRSDRMFLKSIDETQSVKFWHSLAQKSSDTAYFSVDYTAQNSSRASTASRSREAKRSIIPITLLRLHSVFVPRDL